MWGFEKGSVRPNGSLGGLRKWQLERALTIFARRGEISGKRCILVRSELGFLAHADHPSIPFFSGVNGGVVEFVATTAFQSVETAGAGGSVLRPASSEDAIFDDIGPGFRNVGVIGERGSGATGRHKDDRKRQCAEETLH